MTPRRPRLLDLFCGGGGAAMGYHRAGFDVVGVDLTPQREYPFDFHLANALTFDLDGFDAVHASPPCQLYSQAGHLNASTRYRLFNPHPDLIDPIRQRIKASGLPYIIENVVGARRDLIDPIRLCGSSFDLEVVRHRLFELGGFTVEAPPCHQCRGMVAEGRAISVFGHGGGRVDGTRGMRGRFPELTVVESFQRALGIDWLTDVARLAEAIPPAYTEHIGKALREAIA